jgi:hypothetical protein
MAMFNSYFDITGGYIRLYYYRFIVIHVITLLPIDGITMDNPRSRTGASLPRLAAMHETSGESMVVLAECMQSTYDAKHGADIFNYTG